MNKVNRVLLIIVIILAVLTAIYWFKPDIITSLSALNPFVSEEMVSNSAVNQPIISNTNKRRGLADSKYNERRSECETAVELLSKDQPIENLSVLSFGKFMDMKNLIKDETVFRRAKHVISENNRVLKAIDALKNNRLEEFGQLMNESHDSLRDDYEVTGNELDALVEEARKVNGVLGSRMTGAGFGGCTVSLVSEEAVEDFKIKVGKNYFDRTGLVADFYVAEVGDGAKILD